jgi:hypothetical protein
MRSTVEKAELVPVTDKYCGQETDDEGYFT